MGNAAIRRLPSATGPEVEVDPYRDIRKALIAAAYNEENKSRSRNKEAVRMMLGPLTAARKNGETFEAMAALMTQHGYPMAGSTLRNYYYEWYADAQVKALVREQAELLAESRRRLMVESSQVKVREEAAAELANRRKRGGMVSRPKLVSATELTEHDQQQQRGRSTPSAANRITDQASSRMRPSGSETTSIPSGELRPQAAPATVADRTRQSANVADQPLSEGKAPSIAQLKKMAASVKDKVALPMDVELRDGEHAYYIDGRPLDLVLTLRQVRLLESSGRLIATGTSDTPGSRTAEKFVKMPDKL